MNGICKNYSEIPTIFDQHNFEPCNMIYICIKIYAHVSPGKQTLAHVLFLFSHPLKMKNSNNIWYQKTNIFNALAVVTLTNN